jgi:hypothetical protein
MSRDSNWNLPDSHERTTDLAPPISQLYREMQVAHGALARMAAILEHVAVTLPPDGD